MAIPVPSVGDKTTAAFADAVANDLNTQNLGETATGGSVTLATIGTAVASSASVTFTLTATTRVRIKTQCAFQMASGTNGHYNLRGGYNSGASAVIGSVLVVGQLFRALSTVVGSGGAVSAWSEGSVLLTAGTYTAYGSCTRDAGGSATDIAGAFYVAVVTEGFL